MEIIYLVQDQGEFDFCINLIDEVDHGSVLFPNDAEQVIALSDVLVLELNLAFLFQVLVEI